MKPSEIIHNASRLIIEKGWCQNAYARTSSGAKTLPSADDAVCFCMSGALQSVATTVEDQPARLTAREYLSDAVGGNLILWNDEPGRTQDEVVAKMGEALSLALSKE